MAIGVHYAKFALVDEDTDSKTPRTKRILADGNLPNTAGNPTLEDYLVLEAADNFLPSVITDISVITVSVADMNSVS